MAYKIAQYLVERRVDINYKTNLKVIPLFKATQRGDTKMVKILLQHPDIDYSHSSNQGLTALHNVVIGEDGVASIRSDIVPSTNTIEFNSGNYLEIAKLLLDKGMDPNFDNNGSTLTPLMRACETGGA